MTDQVASELAPRSEIAEPKPAEAEIPKSLVICQVRPYESCDTVKVIDVNAAGESLSPIDEYIRTTKLLNVLYGSMAGDSTGTAPFAMQPKEATSLLSSSEDLEAMLAIEDDAVDPVDAENAVAIEASEQYHPEIGVDPALEAPTASSGVPSRFQVDTQMNNLVLLGFVSAVESYLRSLVTRLVSFDEYVTQKVDCLKVTYAAARIHSEDLLAEALMEDMTFISKANVKTLLQEILEINVQQKSDLDALLSEYDRICQLRHCIVHRFGKLGSKNAMSLGLKIHSEHFEKPIQISKDSLQTIAFNLFMTVKAINNTVYESTLKRQAERSEEWTWDESKDAERFGRFYRIFATTLDSEQSPTQADAYTNFSKVCKAKSATVIAQYKIQKRVDKS
jgi:hypothetical protein